MTKSNGTESPPYSIGACARMSGLSRHTLRKWENRYRAVTPARTEGGTRRYTGAEVTRLRLLRELVDSGHAIGAIARLSLSELREMVGEQEPKPAAAGPLRVAVLGETLPDELATHASSMPALSIGHTLDDLDAAEKMEGDILAVEIPSLGSASAQQIEQIRQRSGIERIIVVYSFGPLSLIERLSDGRTAMVRTPLVYAEFERIVRSLTLERSPIGRGDSDIPPHRVGRDELARMSTKATALKCECPRHTSDLVMMLSRFEDYSLQCEQEEPEDAVVHHRLRRHAALARSIMEEALIDLARAEGIELTLLSSDKDSR
ncbi:MAG: MerR family transcriptional regulator [Xanthomonadales bacterium]|nr:MerR family transcriptional regulator [Xanthomonadales bacterium]